MNPPQAIPAKETIHINLQAISPPRLEHMAIVTCLCVKDYFKYPGIEEKYEKWLQERNSRKERT